MPRWSYPTDFFLNSKKSCSPITANDTVERIICYFRRKNCQRCLSDSRTSENDKKISRNILALKISPHTDKGFSELLDLGQNWTIFSLSTRWVFYTIQ